MSKGLFISRKESTIIQGIAAMLMVFRHLFGFPDRINYNFVIVSDLLGNCGLLYIGTMLAYFGRICISIFAFCSGYGIYIKLSKIYSERFFINIKNGYISIINQALKFMCRYWIICAIFIPVGYFIDVYSFDFISLIRCLLGISYPYNAEWWYVSSYLQFLIAVPLFIALEKLFRKYASCVIVNIVYVFIFFVSLVFSIFNINNLSVMLCFLSGIACASTRVFEVLYTLIKNHSIIKYILAIGLLLSVILLRVVLSLNCDYDYLCAPIFVFCIAIFIKSRVFTKYINKILMFVGNYSTYIWLTHTFFGYYYFQQYLFWFKYSTVIFMVCIACCIFVGIVIELVIKKFSKLFSKDKSVKRNA